MRRSLLLILFLLMVAGKVFAVQVNAISLTTLSCVDGAPVVRLSVTGTHIEPVGGTDDTVINIYDGDSVLVASLPMSWVEGDVNVAYTADLTWITPPQSNPLYVVVRDISEARIVADTALPVDCIQRTAYSPAAAYTANDVQLRINNEGDEQYGFSLFGVGLDGESGFAVVSMTAAELAALSETPEENTLIAQGSETTYWGEVNVYQLTTGEIQVNLGPDSEGKVRVTIYDAIPPSRVYGYEFNVLDEPTE